jgi:hypothetical protein
MNTPSIRRLLAVATLPVALAACASSSSDGDGDGDGGGGPSVDSTTRFEGAVETCAVGTAVDPDGLDLGDEGHSLTMNSKQAGGVEEIGCILGTLGTPESVINRMDSTTSMMGELSDEAEGITYRWTYHPDNGLNLILTDSE